MLGQLASVLFAFLFIAAAIGALFGSVRSMQDKGMRIDAMLAWPVVPSVAYLLAEANLGVSTGLKGAIVTAVLMLGCLYRPGASTFRLQLVLGLAGWTALATCGGAIFILVNFLRDNDLRILPTLQDSWPLMLATLLTFGASKGLFFWALVSRGIEQAKLVGIHEAAVEQQL